MFSKQKRWRVKRDRKANPETPLRLRFLFFHGVIAVGFLILAAQLWRMQVVEGSRYRERADSNRTRPVTIPANRGVIYDRNGVILVKNAPSLAAAIVVGDLTEEQRPRVSQALSAILDIPLAEVEEKIKSARQVGTPLTPRIVKDNLDEQAALILKERASELPGVQVMVRPRRNYPAGETTAHILGYVGNISAEEYKDQKDDGYELNDKVGKTGVELSYEKELRGKPGLEEVEVNADGVPLGALSSRAPKEGYNLRLSIDLSLQEEMTRLLREGMAGSDYAAAVAMDPRTGQVLGLVSLPSYDNNLFTLGDGEAIQALLDNPTRPLLNYAVSGRHPPGSTFKLITGTAALEDGVATPRTRITSTGSISVPSQYDPRISYTFRDWAALGELNFYGALAMSSDVYFYYLAGGFRGFRGLGAARLAEHARDFGLDRPTGIDLPNEIPGLIPDPEWKQETLNEPWLLGDTYNFGIGQGYATLTPIQMLVVTSAIANGGHILQPQVVAEVLGSDGHVARPFTPKISHKLRASPQNLAHIVEGMRQSVEWGVADKAKVSGVTVAGKTGSAEFGSPSPRTGEYPTHAWFVGFAPIEDPQIAVVVFAQKGSGGRVSAPIGGKIIDYYLKRR